MRATLAIAWRELASCFRTPLGWLVIALYLLLTGVYFAFATVEPGEPATMRTLFGSTQWMLLVVAPAISMRLLSEELRSGTIETLASCPISDWQIALGKYLGAMGFIIAMLLPTLLQVAVLEAVGDPDYGPILAGYAGVVLVASVYLAAGLVFSALTTSQTVAFLTTLFFFLVLLFGTTQGGRLAPEPWNDVLFSLSIGLRLGDFAKGVLELRHVVFFVAITLWLLAIAVVALEWRRWR
jgi:ABC-2 type transport system permease protein